MTRRERPRAASQAAKTNRVMGSMLVRVAWLVRVLIVIIINRDRTMPSRHSSEDIMWER